MKKRSILLLSSILAVGMLGACGVKKPSSSTSESSSSSTSSEYQAPEKFKIVVANLPDGISYTIDKTEAEEGEDVTFTITNVAEAFSITEVLLNGAALAGNNNVYTFKMPFGGARITVNYTISGDVTIQGEGFAAKLEKDNSTGVYKGIAKITSSSSVAGFNLMIQGEAQDYYKCYDYVNSYGNIQWNPSKNYGFGVATGCTYEFRYNPAAEIPFSVVRTSVDVLPNSADTLYRLFSGDAGSGMRDETCNPLNLKNATYTITDSSGSEFLNYTYDYKKYENHVSLATVNDLQNEESYYTYKNADLANGVFSVIDTYPTALGNNDYYKYDKNPASADVYSFKQDLQEGEIYREGGWFDEPRYTASNRMAIRNVNWSAHAGNALEQELKWAYRVDSTSAVINAASYTKYDVVSTPKENGSFLVELDSVIEENRSGTGNETEEHCGKIYDIDLTFNKEGNITAMSYKYTSYSRDKWNFATHEPSVKVGVTRKITYSAEYGDPNKGTPDFDTSKYFISQINDVTFSNEAAGGDDHVGFGDYVALHDTDGETPKNVKNFSYLPSTALDAWQYEVTSDSENKLDFTYSKGVAANVGETTIHVDNHTKNSGVSYEKKLTISYCKSVAQFYFVGTSRADNCDIYGGDTQSFTVKATAVSGYNSSIVPVQYTPKAYVKKTVVDEFGESKVVNEATDLIEFLRADEKMTIKAKDVEEQTTVYIAMQSDLYAQGKSVTVLTCTIHPSNFDKSSLKNTTWKTDAGYFVDKQGNPLNDYIQVEFKDSTGTIKDVAYDSNGALVSTDTYSFTYTQDMIGRVEAKLTAVNLQSYTLSSQFKEYSWELLIEQKEGMLGLALMASTRSYDGEESFSIFGDWTADGDDEYGYEYECTLMEALSKVS